MHIIIDFLQSIINFIEGSGVFGVVFACGLITVESIIPIMPLVAFITINFIVLGKTLGFFISWIFTIIGCIMSYLIFKNGFGNKFDNLTENKQLLKKYKHMFKDISTGKLLLIVAMPFTPAFMVNIAAGLVKMDFKKYIIAIIIGKVAMVYFWGFIGASFIESIKNPIILVKIVIIMLLTYIVYLILNKVFKLN